MADLPADYTLTEDGTYDFRFPTETKTAIIAAGGDFGGGSLAISWVDSAGNAVEYPDSPLTEGGGFEALIPNNAVSFKLDGSTSASIKIIITPL